MNKKFLCIIAAVIAVLVLLTACGQPKEEPKAKEAEETAETSLETEKEKEDTVEKVELIFWDMLWGDAEGYPDAIEELIDKHNKDNNDVIVKCEFIPWENNYQVFMTAIVSGSAPDVATTSSGYPVPFGSMGALLPLDSIIEEWEQEGIIDDFDELALDIFKYGGKTMAIPWQIDVRGFFYRKDVFEQLGIELPNTFDEFLDVCRKIKKETDMIPLTMGAKGNWGKHPIYMMQKQNYTGMTDEEINPVMDTQANIEVMEFFNTLVKEELIPDGALGYDNDEARKIYYNGEAAIKLGSLAETLLEYPEIAEKSAVLPIFIGPSATKKGVLGYYNPILSFVQTDHPDESKQFIKWLSDNYIDIFKSGTFQSKYPVRKSFMEDEYFSSDWIKEGVRDEILPYILPEVYPAKSYYPAYAAIHGENHGAMLLQSILVEKGDADLKQLAEEFNMTIQEIIDTTD